ncbi:uncharacterized protein BJ212DRAFT_1305982 [Suillus subaureus]|uniref:Uncharacterized protein n=1 Tax=Suillus subaureus TaxID=48587 RepID=A0A9P7IZG7_9AGAM|nr:uncharacterized protein BJ212DRAFT_1305982 [Suillus subaureus]KAG1797575.1 hypothetical protein BJ212DRAFT_1305982 [Suillus subaureus]
MKRHSPTDNTKNRGTTTIRHVNGTRPVRKPSTFKPKQGSPPKNEALYLPLAMVAARLLGTLEGLPDIFFAAKFVRRSGGWPAPSVVPSTDSGSTAWSDKKRTKR